MTLLLALGCVAALAEEPDVAAPPADATTEDVPEAAEAQPEAPPEPAWAPKWPGEPAPDTANYDLEELYAAQKFKEGLKVTQQRIAEHPDDAALYWHAARFMFEIAETFDRHDTSIDKVAHYGEMVALANKGLAIAPDDPHIHFARGIANGRLGTTQGVLKSLWLASTVEQDWLYTANSGFTYSSLDANERLPCDAYLTLGIFYRLVPDWWIVKVLSGTRGDLGKSLDWLQKANQCSPNRMGVMKELAVTEICKGQRDKDDALVEAGMGHIRAYMKLTPENPTDKIDLKHGQMLLDDPSMACEYSRDGQQELDEAKLQK